MRMDSVWKRTWYGLAIWLVAGNLPGAFAQSDPAGFGAVINVPPKVVGNSGSIGSNTQLNLSDGGTIGTRFDAGAEGGGSSNVEVNISGGTIGDLFDANDGSTVNISGGVIGNNSNALFGSTVNITGGVIGIGFDAMPGSTVNVSGGVFDAFFDAFDGSAVNVSGGDIGLAFEAQAGSTVVVNGGRLGRQFEVRTGSDVTLVGGEFLVNGVAPLDLTSVTLSGSDVLTGTLEDGSAFVFSSTYGDLFSFGDVIDGVTLLPGTLPAIDLAPVVIADANDVAPATLRAGQVLTLQGTGVLPDGFVAVDTVLTIEGGTAGSELDIANSTIDVTGGQIEEGCLFGSTLNLEDGDIGTLCAMAGTTVNQSGGTLNFVRLGENSVFNLSGGVFGTADNPGPFSIRVETGGTLNLFVSEASLDGVALDLVPGDTFVVDLQEFNLSGFLTDGSAFSIQDIPAAIGFAFELGSTVTVTLGTPPVAGDFDGDGNVDADDIDFYTGNLGSAATGDLAPLDLDGDGLITLADHDLHVATLVETANGQTGAIIGDINLDGSVDVLSDGFTLIGGLGSTTSSYANGDLNADEVINVLGDALRLVANLGRTNDAD